MISCQILEEGMQVDFLLEIAPKSGANRLANNSDHRLMIEFGIVEARLKLRHDTRNSALFEGAVAVQQVSGVPKVILMAASLIW